VDDARRRLVLIAGGVLGGTLTLSSGLLAAGIFFPAASQRLHSAQVATSDPGSAGGRSPAAGWKPLPAATAPFVPAQLVIDKLHVKAPIEVKGVDSHNQMESPDRPADVAWYAFTSKPGSGSNAVFSGHRDFAKVGPAVFWQLDRLTPGDIIKVVSGDQTEIRYRVSQVWTYSVTSIPMGQVLAADRVDEITIITCSGRYSLSSGYDHRLVLRAVRVAI
jgi:LPXTG-site transpeptidase (sortase) family protein